MSDAFASWLARWRLIPDGDPIRGPNSSLLPVRRDGRALMLKAAMQPREVRASTHLQWLGGEGAVEVVERENDAILMERVQGTRSLVEIDAAGDEEGAFAILCATAAALHQSRGAPPPEATPLRQWLQRLRDVSAQDNFFARMAGSADALLAEQRDDFVLHGDLHHWNVLDGGERGWLAIDPNALVGERTFEFALMVLPTNTVEDTIPPVLERRCCVVAEIADLDPRRLMMWVGVQAALWAAWSAPGRDWVRIAEAASLIAARGW